MPDQNGVIQPEALARAIQPDTKLISVQAANNETGVIQPTEQIGALARQRRILFHCDAVQAFGHITISVKHLCCDLLSVSAHKLYGPRGIGFLYIRSGVPLPAMLHGGGQENGRRSGTENIPAISGFRIAADLALDDMHQREEREKQLLDQFVNRLSAAVPSCRVLGENALRVPGICALHIPGLPAEYAIAKLDMQGIMVSGGAACASHSAAPSHVYTAMGLTPDEAACVLRISPGRSTTQEEMLAACDALIAICRDR
jgi:cysteine desulfurase